MDIGGTSPWMGEGRIMQEQLSRVTQGAVTEDARAENNSSSNFMKTTMVLSAPDALKTFPMSLWVKGGNVVNAGAINALELCYFSTC